MRHVSDLYAGRRAVMRLWLCPLVAGLFALPASAQVSGLVLDPSDRPVPGATVQLWVESRQAAATRTDEAGRFEVAAPQGEGRLMLTIRRLGLQTRTVPLASRDTSIVIHMELQPVVLEPLTVASRRPQTCPNREDPRARALWAQMRSRYWQPQRDTVFVFGFMELRSGVGEKTDVDRPEAGQVGTGWTTGGLVWAHPELMALSGYATRASGGVGERTAYWSYRALDQGAIQDFTGEHFGAVHTFSMIGSGDGDLTIAFCPRERMRQTGQIEGTLGLRQDTTLQWARWRFRTPAPDEDAGGEASYYPPSPELGFPLLARETLFWRKTGLERYYFEVRTFTGWERRRGGTAARR